MTQIKQVEDLVEKVKKEPQVIARNKVTKLIGEGAFAYVLECAFDQFGRRKGALKLPKNEEAITDIETRKTILSALGNSPFSTDIVDQGEYAGVPFVVEEFRESTLADLIEENKTKKYKPSKEETLSLGKQLLSGIDYFHRLKETDPIASEKLGMNSLTHSDIKPSNILFFKDPRTGETKWEYTDFGIRINTETDGTGKQIVNSVSAASLASIRNKGKDGRFNENIYASPEVRKALVLGQTPPASVQSDLWSIGAVLFAYATGKAPDWGESDVKEARKDLPEGLNEFFSRILNGSAEKRYSSAKEAINGLEECVKEKVDSYILGIARNKEGQYFLFKQPMAKGKMEGKWVETDKWNANLLSLQMIYVPDLDNLVLSYAVVGSSNMLKVSVYEKGFYYRDEKKSHIQIGEYYNDQQVKKQLVEVVRRNSDGRTVLRVEFKKKLRGWFEWEAPSLLPEYQHIRACYELPSLTESGIQEFEETKPTVFGDWKRIKNSQYFGNYYLRIEDGKIATYKNNGNDEHKKTETLPFHHVTRAIWVEK